MVKGKVFMVLHCDGSQSKDHQKLLKCVEDKLGLKNFVEARGYELVPIVDEDTSIGKSNTSAEIIVEPHGSLSTTSTSKIKLSFTADDNVHVDLQQEDCVGNSKSNKDHNGSSECERSPKRRRISVSDLTNSNHVSAAEHVITSILVLVRSYNETLQRNMRGVKWNANASIRNNFDIENRTIGIVGAGRVGYRIMERLVAFNPKKILYYDPRDLPAKDIKKLNVVGLLINQRGDIVQRVDELEHMLSSADVVTINCPLNQSSYGLFNKALISHMKNGSFLINASKGSVCVEEDIKDAIRLGKLAGYSGDVQCSKDDTTDVKDILEGFLQRRHGQKTN